MSLPVLRPAIGFGFSSVRQKPHRERKQDVELL